MTSEPPIPGLHYHQGARPTGSVDALAAYARNQSHAGKIPKAQTYSLPNPISGARPYQNTGVAWMLSTLVRHGGCILADEMGLGKTFQTLNAIRLMKVNRVLILCPGSVRETWRDEIAKWVGTHAAVIYPGCSKRAWIVAGIAKYVVCSYDYRMIQKTLDTAFQMQLPEVLVMDEAHRLRGRDSKRAKVFAEVAPLIPYKIALTGTPQWNSMRDWYQLLHILFDRRFGNQWDFDRRYAGAVAGHHGGLEYPKKEDASITPQILNTQELKLRLSFYMLGRDKASVAKDMPPMTVSIRWVEGTPAARKALMSFQVAKGTIHDAIVATLKGKIDETVDLAAEAQRFVLTTWTNSGAQELHRILNERGTPCLLATASQSGPARAEVIREAVRRRVGLVATTDLFAEGLNLQEVASVGILHALDHVPEKMAQLFNRLHRIGISSPVTWHVVAMRDSVDQLIIDAGVFKLDQLQKIMGRGKSQQLSNAFKGDTKQTAASEKAALAAIYSAMEARNDGIQHSKYSPRA